MTTIPKKEREFDAVAMMRESRDVLSRETAEMSYSEQKRFIEEEIVSRSGRKQLMEGRKVV